MDRPKIWDQQVKAVAETVHKATLVHSKCSRSQQGGYKTGISWIVGPLHRRLLTGMAQVCSPGGWPKSFICVTAQITR